MDISESHMESQPVTIDNSLPSQTVDPESQLNETERKRAKLMIQIQEAQQFFITISKGLIKILEDLTSHIIKR